MSSPLGLYKVPDTSDTPTTLAPFSWRSCAATEPTFPNPCTATVEPAIFRPSRARSSSTTIITPRPVASRRPRAPPTARSFPVTMPYIGSPRRTVAVSMNQFMIREFVFTSGAGMSCWGPTRGRIIAA